MTDRALLALARRTLTGPEFDVWFAKHYQDRGRRSGSLTLGISEDAWRHRLKAAIRKVDQARAQEEAA